MLKKLLGLLLFIFFNMTSYSMECVASKSSSKVRLWNATQQSVFEKKFEEPLDQKFVDHVCKYAPENVENIIHYIEHYNKFNFKSNVAVFVGPRGSGKSTLARAVAQKSKRPCLFINSCLLLDKYQNCVNDNLRQLLKPIIKDKKPCVVVIDELALIIHQSEHRHALCSIIDECKEKYPFIFFIGTIKSLYDVSEFFRDRIMWTIPLAHPSSEAIKNAIMLQLGDNHTCSEQYITALSKRAYNQSYWDIARVMKNIPSIAERRQCASAENGTSEDIIISEENMDKATQNWYSWYHPVSLYHNSKSYFKPFAKEVLPVVLQVSVLSAFAYYSHFKMHSFFKSFARS